MPRATISLGVIKVPLVRESLARAGLRTETGLHVEVSDRPGWPAGPCNPLPSCDYICDYTLYMIRIIPTSSRHTWSQTSFTFFPGSVGEGPSGCLDSAGIEAGAPSGSLPALPQIQKTGLDVKGTDPGP